MNRKQMKLQVLLLITGVAMLHGCLMNEEPVAVQSADPDDRPPVTNDAPTLWGTPPSSSKIGEEYSFTPNATDPDGDELTFSVENRPNWATFDSSNGTLSGIPTLGDIGMHDEIRISASDGIATTAMARFSVNVTQVGSGATTLSWTPPSQNDDGSPLTNLAGYRIYYGVSPGNYPNEIEIANPGITTFVVDNLTPDTYYFVSTAYNSNGAESRFSGMATKTVN